MKKNILKRKIIKRYKKKNNNNPIVYRYFLKPNRFKKLRTGVSGVE